MSECECDSPYPQFCSNRIVKARKIHRCGECCNEIKIDEKYEYTAGVWDREFQVFKTCLDCHDVKNYLDRNEHEICENLYEYICNSGIVHLNKNRETQIVIKTINDKYLGIFDLIETDKNWKLKLIK